MVKSSILVVDDDLADREVLRTLLEEHGHHVLEARNAAIALNLARATPPDLVITDLVMPAMDGYELVRRLREETALDGTRVVFYSGHYLEAEARSLAATCGVDRVLTKPCRHEEILRVVDGLLEERQASSDEALRDEPAAFDRTHLRVVTDKLAEKVSELEQVNPRLGESSAAELEQQARIAAALARIGRELIGLSTTPEVLERLCALATEMLSCGVCHALLWHRGRRVLVPTAGHGQAPEEWEAMRALEIPEALLPSTLRILERGETVEAAAGDDEFAVVARRFGITRSLLAPLRRRGEMVGILSAAIQDPSQGFRAGAHAMALGVAELASLALENAWLADQLAAANRVKSEFVATMSHELRTPLHVILGYNELLRGGDLGAVTPAQSDALSRLHHSAVQLLKLVDATLDLGRLETRQLPVHTEPLSLFDLVTELASEGATIWRKPGVALRFEVPPNLPRLWTDRVKVKCVLENLIDNAVKFTDRGVVTISARSEHRGVEIAVADTGAGIPEEALDFIFDAFRQLDGSDARPHGGLGLGLYIVRRLVDLLGGEVTVESDVGRGATFCVWLPLEARAEAARPSPT